MSPRLYGAQATGCAPIVRLVERGDGQLVPEIPDTIARSIAIGNPADGAYAAESIRKSGGWAASVSDADLVKGIKLLAETAGIFTETAGGVTLASALELARTGHFRAEDEVVLCITGNGLKTVEALAGSLDEAPVLAPRLRDVADLVARTSQNSH